MRGAMLAAALAALPAAAAAGTQGAIPVDPDHPVSGTLTGGTQTWSLDLQGGKYYALWANVHDPGEVSIGEAGGTLAAFHASPEDASHGASFRAPHTGTFTVTVACSTSAGVSTCPGAYRLSAGPDCPASTAAHCDIAVGQTLDGLQMRFVENVDWFRTTLQPGVTYQVTIGTDPLSASFGAHVAVRGPTGEVLAQNIWAGQPGQALVFAPRTGGLHFIEVGSAGNEALAAYSLTLSAGAQGRGTRSAAQDGAQAGGKRLSP
jgi:hypothetical protein